MGHIYVAPQLKKIVTRIDMKTGKKISETITEPGESSAQQALSNRMKARGLKK